MTDPSATSAVDPEVVRAATLAHELRNALHSATIAHELLKLDMALQSPASTVLDRSLATLAELLERSFDRPRTEGGLGRSSTIPISALIERARAVSTFDAASHGVTFDVDSPVLGLEVEGDALHLDGALSNLLRNAFKFTGRGGHVRLASRAVAERVLIEVSDTCGGLPRGDSDDLFEMFEQRSVDRSGLGIGLAVARANVRAMKGDVYARDVPSRGCVFTIDLPRTA